MGATTEDISFSIHPHPTLAETVMEAAEGIYGASTHLNQKASGQGLPEVTRILSPAVPADAAYKHP